MLYGPRDIRVETRDDPKTVLWLRYRLESS